MPDFECSHGCSRWDLVQADFGGGIPQLTFADDINLTATVGLLDGRHRILSLDFYNAS
jgi:hypothetical protein